MAQTTPRESLTCLAFSYFAKNGSGSKIQEFSDAVYEYYINGKEETFKLPPGYAITYDTGLIHRVNEVTQGERHAVVFWSKSSTKDRFLIELYNDLEKLSILIKELIQTHNIELDCHDYEDLMKNPLFMSRHIKNKLIRKIK